MQIDLAIGDTSGALRLAGAKVTYWDVKCHYSTPGRMDAFGTIYRRRCSVCHTYRSFLCLYRLL